MLPIIISKHDLHSTYCRSSILATSPQLWPRLILELPRPRPPRGRRRLGTGPSSGVSSSWWGPGELIGGTNTLDMTCLHNRYTSLQYIGEGAYGMVVSAYDNQTKTKVSYDLVIYFNYLIDDFKGGN